MKLVRNLGCYYSDPKYYNPNNDRCIILYNWIYNTKKKYKHSNEIITECFNDYIHLMSHVPGNHKCSYDSYINFYEEPIKMTILDIFNNNIQNIIIKLMGGYGNDNFSAQNFVCECVKLYKEMEKQYCTKKIGMDNKSVQTCQMLKSFKTTYMEFFYKKLDKNDNIPSLYNVEDEYTNKCLSNKIELPKGDPTYDNVHALSSLPEDADEKKNEFSSPQPYNNEKTDSSMSSTVSTAIGTMAGASSIIALLYKVTQNFI
ncbi:hypothetical protein PVIIG_05196 [Plasmodium vivax India VII]|uniref:Variable surface protein Vir7-like protein n=1 Tax=Plasmodium vivax India VII TaxID=1077284 RepID=A0A0J9UUT8_PLAVI|nr:hypothetical protein PVIIG_05196 [Plasmodium vivax India VII]